MRMRSSCREAQTHIYVREKLSQPLGRSFTVSAKSEIGNVNEKVTSILDGKDMVIAFNGKYLSEYLKIVTDEFIKLNLNTSIDPCVITPVGGEGFLYLVLPVRINA